MSTTAASLESIVLDEGFGTLDAATLDVVAATLENLAARGDRMVGRGHPRERPRRAGAGPLRGAQGRPDRARGEGRPVTSSGDGREAFRRRLGSRLRGLVRGRGDGDGPASPSTAQVDAGRGGAGGAVGAARRGRRGALPRRGAAGRRRAPQRRRAVDRGGGRRVVRRASPRRTRPGWCAATCAAGCAELAGARVARGLFTASPSADDVLAGSVRYAVHRVNGTGEASKLPAAVQAPLTALEIDVSGGGPAAGSDGADLLVRGRAAAQPPPAAAHDRLRQDAAEAVPAGRADRRWSPRCGRASGRRSSRWARSGAAGRGTCGCRAAPGRRGRGSSGSSARRI